MPKRRGRFYKVGRVVDTECHPSPPERDPRACENYPGYIDNMARWEPQESGDLRLVHDKLAKSHSLLYQPSLRALQSPLTLGGSDRPLTPLSVWIVDYAKTSGAYLDTSAPAKHVESSRINPSFCGKDYMLPPSGYRAFNQFFARHIKPGCQLIAALGDPSVVVLSVDACSTAQWPIAMNLTIEVAPQTIAAKGMRLSITELLSKSKFAERSAGGGFMDVALQNQFIQRRGSVALVFERESRIETGGSPREHFLQDPVLAKSYRDCSD